MEQSSLSATAFDALGGTSDWDQALKPPPISASAFKPAGTQRPDQASITKAPRLTPLVRVSSSKGLLRSALPPGAIKEASKGTEPDSDTKAEARRMTNQDGIRVFNGDSFIGKLVTTISISYILSHKLEVLLLLLLLIVLLKLVSLGRT